MRRRLATTAIALTGAFLLTEASALAQYAQPPRRSARSNAINPSPGAGYKTRRTSNIFNRPTTSPYLNLLRPQTEAPNYQSLVRPQLQQERDSAQQGAAIRSLQSQIGSLETRGQSTSGIRTTGHATAFLDKSGYFVAPTTRMGRQGSSTAPVGGTGAY